MLIVRCEYGFNELYKNSWSGAIDTLKTIMEYNLENELMRHLEEIFYEGATDTEINDYLWFESDYIFEVLGINEEEEEEEEE